MCALFDSLGIHDPQDELDLVIPGEGPSTLRAFGPTEAEEIQRHDAVLVGQPWHYLTPAVTRRSAAVDQDYGLTLARLLRVDEPLIDPNQLLAVLRVRLFQRLDRDASG